jgi:ribulose-5-phosphate 4-epimerase/fuculose-1-phosphate aldolase
VSVTTYRPVATAITCREDDAGAMVLFEDYRKLETENAALREDKERLEKAFDQLVMDRDLFCYLCWLEENRDRDVDLKGADYLVMASDGTTCWGKTYREAVMVAEQYDRAAIDAARKEAKP